MATRTRSNKKTKPSPAQQPTPKQRLLSPVGNFENYQRIVRDQGGPEFSNILPSGIDTDLFVSAAFQAFRNQPALSQCTGLSVLNALWVAAKLGLDCSGIGGEGWLTAMQEQKTHVWYTVYLPGYRGLLKLAYQHPSVLSVESTVVRKADIFEFNLGTEKNITHRWRLGEDRGEIIGAYAMAVLKGDVPQFHVMSDHEIKALSGNSEAWTTKAYRPEMYRKTVVKRLLKYIPSSNNLRAAIDLDNLVIGQKFNALPMAEVSSWRDSTSNQITNYLSDAGKKEGKS